MKIKINIKNITRKNDFLTKKSYSLVYYLRNVLKKDNTFQNDRFSCFGEFSTTHSENAVSGKTH